MSDFLKIELTGVDGSYWCLSGPGMGQQGVTISPNIQNFADAPVKTLWVPGPYGEQYVGKRVQRREMVFTVQAFDESDPDNWATIDSMWRWAWDYDNECTMTVTTSDGVRTINLRLLEAPKAWGNKDPHLTADNPVVMTTAAEFPYWIEPSTLTEWSSPNTNDQELFPIKNDGDVPVWIKWTLTDLALWQIPDFSWGNPMYARASQDAGRTLWLPQLQAGESVVVDSDPRVQTIVAANDSPVQHRWSGNDLLYPLMPGAYGEIPLVLSQSTRGGVAELEVPRWFSRPWSRPKVFGAL